MDSGKTTAAFALINGLTLAGLGESSVPYDATGMRIGFKGVGFKNSQGPD